MAKKGGFSQNVRSLRTWRAIHIYKKGMTVEEAIEVINAGIEDIQVLDRKGDLLSCEICDDYYFERNIKYGDFTLYKPPS